MDEQHGLGLREFPSSSNRAYTAGEESFHPVAIGPTLLVRRVFCCIKRSIASTMQITPLLSIPFNLSAEIGSN